MKIVLEGPNGSGKSTLAKYLAEAFDTTVFHPGGPPKSYQHMLSNISTQMDRLRKGEILDRCTPISEVVYTEEPLNPKKAYVLGVSLYRMVDMGTIFIYTTGVSKITNKDYYPEGHYEYVKDNYYTIIAKYKDVFRNIPHIQYNFYVDTEFSIIQQIINMTGVV